MTIASFELALELANIAERLQASTVQISGGRGNSGSGTIWRSDGLIITNAHVVRGWQTTVVLADERVLEAEVTAQDPQRDLAALRVEATDLPTITIGDASKLRVGELVLAVGNPFGATGALTMGIVHSLDGEATGKIKQTKVYAKKSFVPNLQSQGWVVADIRLAPGNSGGPLANARGEVIGINTAIAGGLALVVPSYEVERFLASPHRITLGVTMQPVLVPWENGRVIGWLVLEVAFGSLAMATGLQRGDIIISLNRRYFRTPNELAHFLWNAQPGDCFLLEFLRDRKCYERTVVVGSNAK
ncbi:MAG: trypsin-like peptidase domain-containing protein [Hydrococcus sp. C42_A2020_068]|uniref:S1C family serine protease n=1 Tax=Pleurocapsa sp. PCC 7327 TaxID=118163 RepID=UPI00029FB135|nr:trypsin-like peptidase domain-containing protein [Pleurocapsa sp. PCC 7327]AFY77505.1 trypsin-like serine protease with C-terminal PDZ domain [Pleurocapsa sp. PCC 7327]MBF2022263.1 trypsin-like peptidase domain-containing protein [Hydrococcus sp. C42_A2020_068]